MNIRMDKGIHRLASMILQCTGVGLIFFITIDPLLVKGSYSTITMIPFMFFTLRYPHEYAHWAAGKVMGIESAINFRKMNATCTPKSVISSKELIIFALAPCVSIGIPLLTLTLVPLEQEIHYVIVGLLIYHLISCYFDFVYTYYAIKYKQCRFNDYGLELEIIGR